MATITDPVVRAHKREVIDKAVLRFCGDSGDGMQITGSQFTNTVALYGNDLATFPDYPAEIRAPCGNAPGRQRFPDSIFLERRVHAGRFGGRARGDESGRAQDEHQGPEDERHPDREQRRLYRRRPAQGAHHLESARGSFARRLPLVRGGPGTPDARGAAGTGPRRQVHGPLQEFLCAGHVLLALQPHRWT